MLWKDILSHKSPELGIPWPVIHWSSSKLIALCLTFSLVTRMKLTYHPTLELAPSATCLQKCWMRAWTEITFSLTSWRTCTVLDSSFGRSLGDVYQEVSDSDIAGAAADPFGSEIRVTVLFTKSDLTLFSPLFLLMRSQSSQNMVFNVLELSLS